MKLTGRAADGYFARPDPTRTGLLLFGEDGGRVAAKRRQVLAALLGPGAEEEMRLTRMAASELRNDPGGLVDAIKATGFFPGVRAVLVEEAGDAAAPAVAAALEDWRDGDAHIVVTAGALRATSKLRKLFENHDNSYAAGIYDTPPDRAEIARALGEAGLGEAPPDSLAALTDLAAGCGPGEFAQLLEKLVLYKDGENTPISYEDLQAVAPPTAEADVDTLIDIVAEARFGEIGPVLRRLQAQGTTPVGLCLTAGRHFRALYAAAADPGGAAAGVGRLRPPVFGPRRDRMIRQAQDWGAIRLAAALEALVDTDLALRSAGQTAPQMALVERTLIRLAMMPRER